MIPGKVNYDHQEQDWFFDDVPEHVIHFFLDGVRKEPAPSIEAWTPEFLNYWANLLAQFAPFIKHPRFEAERE